MFINILKKTSDISVTSPLGQNLTYVIVSCAVKGVSSMVAAKEDF